MDENHSYSKSTQPISFFDTSRSELQMIPLDFHKKKNLQLYVKRDDLIDTEVSGNKWRKLELNVALAMHLKKDGIVTFGGAYSNHLLATASACNRLGLQSIGIVRGDELTTASNSNLTRCAALGMHLEFVSRSVYDCRCETGEQDHWKEKYGTYLLVPEGGANYHGILGCQSIVQEIQLQMDHVFVAQGTTATSCGILLGVSASTQVHVVPVLKGFDVGKTMQEMLQNVIMDSSIVDEYLDQVVVHDDFHFGGYGKWTEDLVAFIAKVAHEINVPLDKIYTGKAFAAMMDWINKTDFEQPTSCVFIHTGGLVNG